MFENDFAKDRLMKTAIKAFKNVKLDIRQFKIRELTTLIELVVKHSPADLNTFFKYVDQSTVVAQGSGNFESLAKLFNLFVEQGYMENQSLLYMTTHLALKEMLVGEKGISPDLLIHLSWSMIAMEDPEAPRFSNPLVPKTLEAPTKFKREKALSSEELIKLYQIHLFIKEKVKLHQLDPEMKHVIPKDLLKAASEEYERFDRSFIFADVQSDIAHKLLKLRVSFKERVACSEEMPAYSCNFKLMGKNEGKIFVFKGDENSNVVNGEWLGLNRLKMNHLFSWTVKEAGKVKVNLPKFDITVIDVNEWRGMSEQKKLTYLYNIVIPVKESAE